MSEITEWPRNWEIREFGYHFFPDRERTTTRGDGGHLQIKMWFLAKKKKKKKKTGKIVNTGKTHGISP